MNIAGMEVGRKDIVITPVVQRYKRKPSNSRCPVSREIFGKRHGIKTVTLRVSVSQVYVFEKYFKNEIREANGSRKSPPRDFILSLDDGDVKIYTAAYIRDVNFFSLISRLPR